MTPVKRLRELQQTLADVNRDEKLAQGTRLVFVQGLKKAPRPTPNQSRRKKR